MRVNRLKSGNIQFSHMIVSLYSFNEKHTCSKIICFKYIQYENSSTGYCAIQRQQADKISLTLCEIVLGGIVGCGM